VGLRRVDGDVLRGPALGGGGGLAGRPGARLAGEGMLTGQGQAQAGPAGLQVPLGVLDQPLRHGLVRVGAALRVPELALVPVGALLQNAGQTRAVTQRWLRG
jgi:hypothetical protein